MISEVGKSLSKEELKILVQSLYKMDDFLRKKGMRLDDQNYHR